MNDKYLFLPGWLAVLVLLLASCSVNKFVPEGRYLLDEVRVVSDDKEVKPSAYRSYVRQHPNAKWFSLLKVPLRTYCLSGKDSTRRFNRFIRRIGEAPVVYDAVQTHRSVTELTKALNNRGYLAASVSVEEKCRGRKMRLTYRLHPERIYRVRQVRFDLPDAHIEHLVRTDSAASRLSPGMVFNVEVLDAERQRITELLQAHGYYKFNKDFLSYTADTARRTYLVDLTMHLQPYRASASDPPQPHPCYRIRQVCFMADGGTWQSTAATSGINAGDSVHYKGFPIYYKEKLFLRPRVLTDNLHIRPGSLYNDKDVLQTYASFGRLRALKYTNVRFAEVQGEDRRLDAYVMLTKGKDKSFSAELEGTNSAGDLGAAASLSFQHRNVFRGSELFTIKLRGAYEAITGLQGYSNEHYTEYGVEASLNFPCFLFPFLSSEFKRRVRASSEVSMQYNSQVRPEFSRTIASAAWSYKWAMRKAQHRVDLLDINYVYMPRIEAKFKQEYLDSLNNSILKYNYENLLIVKLGYTYQYHSAGAGSISAKNSYSIRFGIESAGNIFYGISNLIHQRKVDGKYVIWNIGYAQYVKADFDFAKHFQVDSRNAFALHAALGVAFPYGNSDMLPFEKRYFSGGANSVRGWGVRELGPGSFRGGDKGIDFMNQSGDVKLDLSIEYRTRLFWKLHAAAFVDAGNIWTIRNYKEQPGGQFRFRDFYKQIAVSYGLGLRFDFDFLVVRFDGGMKAVNPAYTTSREHFPLVHPRFSRDFAFHFAVGYPF